MAEQNKTSIQTNEEPKTQRGAAPERGAGGLDLPSQGEIAGGKIEDELRAEPPGTTPTRPLDTQRRYIRSKLAQEAGGVIGRSPENIGLFGKGERFRGQGILVDVDSMKKVRVYDGYTFQDDRVFANSRDLPQALVTGDITENLGG